MAVRVGFLLLAGALCANAEYKLFDLVSGNGAGESLLRSRRATDGFSEVECVNPCTTGSGTGTTDGFGNGVSVEQSTDDWFNVGGGNRFNGSRNTDPGTGNGVSVEQSTDDWFNVGGGNRFNVSRYTASGTGNGVSFEQSTDDWFNVGGGNRFNGSRYNGTGNGVSFEQSTDDWFNVGGGNRFNGSRNTGYGGGTTDAFGNTWSNSGVDNPSSGSCNCINYNFIKRFSFIYFVMYNLDTYTSGVLSYPVYTALDSSYNDDLTQNTRIILGLQSGNLMNALSNFQETISNRLNRHAKVSNKMKCLIQGTLSTSTSIDKLAAVNSPSNTVNKNNAMYLMMSIMLLVNAGGSGLSDEEFCTYIADSMPDTKETEFFLKISNITWSVFKEEDNHVASKELYETFEKNTVQVTFGRKIKFSDDTKGDAETSSSEDSHSGSHEHHGSHEQHGSHEKHASHEKQKQSKGKAKPLSKRKPQEKSHSKKKKPQWSGNKASKKRGSKKSKPSYRD